MKRTRREIEQLLQDQAPVGRFRARVGTKTPVDVERRVRSDIMRRAGAGTRETYVFLNVPYDSQYEKQFLALIAGLVGLGLTPRCTLEVPPVANRLSRIFRLIRECPYSIHDLSRIELAKGRPSSPRFNMPFEAGLAVATALGGNQHEWFLMEAKRHRLQKSLSDLNGFDPYIHRNEPQGVLQALTQMFVRPSKQPTATDLASVYTQLNRFAKGLKMDQMDGDIFQARHFSELVRAARRIVIAERQKLSPKRAPKRRKTA